MSVVINFNHASSYDILFCTITRQGNIHIQCSEHEEPYRLTLCNKGEDSGKLGNLLNKQCNMSKNSTFFFLLQEYRKMREMFLNKCNPKNKNVVTLLVIIKIKLVQK